MTSKCDEKVEVTYDDVLEDIGSFNKYQILTLFCLIIPSLSSGLTSTEYIFSAAAIPYRCFIQECDTGPSAPVYNTIWLDVAMPTNKRMESCERFAPANNTSYNESKNEEKKESELCPAWLFDRENTIKCDHGYVYGRNDSVVYDFHLECQEWKRVAIGSYRNIGMIFGQLVSGFYSDRFGRKITMMLLMFNQFVIGVIRSFSMNYEMFVVMHVLDTFLASGSHMCSMMIANEMVSPKWRPVTTAVLMSYHTCGSSISALLAWWAQDWRLYILLIILPQAIQLINIWTLDESVRWLINKRKFIEAKKIIAKISKINSKLLTDDTIDKMNSVFHKKECQIANQKDGNKSSVSLFVTQVINSKMSLRLLMTVPLMWFCTKFVSYGLALNSVKLNGNMYMNYILVNMIDVPAYASSTYIVQKIGRKLTIFSSYVISGICCLTFAVIAGRGYIWLSLIIYFVGKFFISVVSASLNIFTIEVFPTQFRHSFTSISSSFSRIATSISPLTPALMIYWTPLPVVLFGVIAIMSGLLALLTPETTNTKLPESITEVDERRK